MLLVVAKTFCSCATINAVEILNTAHSSSKVAATPKFDSEKRYLKGEKACSLRLI